MTYLELLEKFTAIATENPQQFRSFWESACMAHCKMHNFGMSAKWLLGQEVLPAGEIYVLSDAERAAEEALNVAMNHDDKGAAKDRQFRKVFGWMESTDVGDAIVGKLKASKPAKREAIDSTEAK
jgi:hypothetical protein